MPRSTGWKGSDVDRGAEPVGDVRGRRVGLLGAQAALLDREVRPVAGRVDVLDAADASVLVDRDEAALVLGQAGDRRPVHRRQGDHLVRLDSPVSRGQDQLAALALVGEGSGLDLDPAGGRATALTASLAAGPKMASGASSGVTTVSRTSSSPSSSALRCVIRASS